MRLRTRSANATPRSSPGCSSEGWAPEMSIPPSVAGEPLAFKDARGCKEWLETLPLTNIPQAQALVLDGLRALNAAEFDPLERLKSLELAREKVAFLQGEQ